MPGIAYTNLDAAAETTEWVKAPNGQTLKGFSVAAVGNNSFVGTVSIEGQIVGTTQVVQLDEATDIAADPVGYAKNFQLFGDWQVRAHMTALTAGDVDVHIQAVLAK